MVAEELYKWQTFNKNCSKVGLICGKLKFTDLQMLEMTLHQFTIHLGPTEELGRNIMDIYGDD